jgi:hypothetical protein
LHAESPHTAANPLTSKVSSARNSTRTARGTAASISQDPGHRLPPQASTGRPPRHRIMIDARDLESSP